MYACVLCSRSQGQDGHRGSQKISPDENGRKKGSDVASPNYHLPWRHSRHYAFLKYVLDPVRPRFPLPSTSSINMDIIVQLCGHCVSRQGLSPSPLAKLLGVSPSAVAKYSSVSRSPSQCPNIHHLSTRNGHHCASDPILGPGQVWRLAKWSRQVVSPNIQVCPRVRPSVPTSTTCPPKPETIVTVSPYLVPAKYGVSPSAVAKWSRQILKCRQMSVPVSHHLPRVTCPSELDSVVPVSYLVPPMRLAKCCRHICRHPVSRHPPEIMVEFIW